VNRRGLGPAANGDQRSHQAEGGRQTEGQLLGAKKGLQLGPAQPRSHLPGQGGVGTGGAETVGEQGGDCQER
jgi:hypothetical protein